MRTPVELVTHAFRHPSAVRQYSMGEWDRLVRQARQSGLLARFYGLLHDHAVETSIPEVARWHFEAAAFVAKTQQAELRRTLTQLRAVLGDVESPLVALRSTAYVAAGLPVARGRQIDATELLVSHENVARVESTLEDADWHRVQLPAYEHRHRRRWCHESWNSLRPGHATVLDLHHAIVPDGARFRPDTQRLRQRAREIPGFPGIAVPCAEDRILHAATALMHDDGLQHGLRHLSDLDLLLRAEGGEVDFWARLPARAEEMDLQRPLFYALRYARHFFATPVPQELSDRLAAAGPGPATLALMDSVYLRMLAPRHPSCADALTPLARKAAYLHAHWLRRPPRQLLPHLVRKTLNAPFRSEPNPA